MRVIAASILALLLAPEARAAEDTSAPVVEHTPVQFTKKGDKVVEVFAKITDESKFFPQVFYRYGAGEYSKPLDMKPVKGQKNMYGAAPFIKGDLLEYYIEAYDDLGNGPGRAGSPEKPFRVDTSGAGGLVAEAKPPPPPPPQKKVEEPPPPPPRKTQVAAAPAKGRTWTWAVGGVGLGLLTGGLVAGLAVKTADDAYSARLKDPTNSAASLKAQYDANKSLGTKATILTISGGVLLAGAVALFFIEGSGDDAPPPKSKGFGGGMQGAGSTSNVSVAAAPLEGGGAVAIAGRF